MGLNYIVAELAKGSRGAYRIVDERFIDDDGMKYDFLCEIDEYLKARGFEPLEGGLLLNYCDDYDVYPRVYAKNLNMSNLQHAEPQYALTRSREMVEAIKESPETLGIVHRFENPKGELNPVQLIERMQQAWERGNYLMFVLQL